MAEFVDLAEDAYGKTDNAKLQEVMVQELYKALLPETAEELGHEWATNVGNEWGQVLICVLTTSEGSGLNESSTLQRLYVTSFGVHIRVG